MHRNFNSATICLYCAVFVLACIHRPTLFIILNDLISEAGQTGDAGDAGGAAQGGKKEKKKQKREKKQEVSASATVASARIPVYANLLNAQEQAQEDFREAMGLADNN